MVPKNFNTELFNKLFSKFSIFYKTFYEENDKYYVNFDYIFSFCTPKFFLKKRTMRIDGTIKLAENLYKNINKKANTGIKCILDKTEKEQLIESITFIVYNFILTINHEFSDIIMYEFISKSLCSVRHLLTNYDFDEDFLKKVFKNWDLYQIKTKSIRINNNIQFECHICYETKMCSVSCENNHKTCLECYNLLQGEKKCPYCRCNF